MLCRSIAEKGYNRVAELIADAEMAEIRIEECELSVEEVSKLFASHKNLIATCRPKNLSPAQQTKLLTAAINAGAAWVDIEIEAEAEYRNHMVEVACDAGCKVIISYHNYSQTPVVYELVNIATNAKRFGADLVKVATTVNSKMDICNLFSLYTLDYDVLAIGMGKLGMITRIAALTMGSPFTFVSMNDVAATAPGQIDEKSMQGIVKTLQLND